MTTNGDAVYVPPPDTVLDTMWVQDSLIIPISFSYIDTILRNEYSTCENSSLHLSFRVDEVVDDFDWDANEVSLAGALNSPDLPEVILRVAGEDTLKNPLIDQYLSENNANYYFQQRLTQAGSYSLELTHYDLANNQDAISLSAYLLQSGTSADAFSIADSSLLVLTCSTAVTFEDSLPGNAAIWSNTIHIQAGDSLWGDFSSNDSLDFYLIKESGLPGALQNLVQNETLSPSPLYSSKLDGPLLDFLATENTALVLLVFNPSSLNQYYEVTVKQSSAYWITNE